MAWVLAILSFIFSFIALFSTGLFVLSCISAVINPQITVENGTVVDKNRNSRYMLLIILAFSWAIVIAISII
jgi:thiol:disulfide interchange protein